jgi:Protein of unknown function (DUF1553)/Protein of unknown function (DUF1549)/Bacterial Ig-like domain (group 2)
MRAAACLRRTFVRLKAEAASAGIGFALLLLAAVIATGVAPRAGAPEETDDLAVLPDTIVLRGQGSRQQLLVEARAGETYVGTRTASSTFSSSNPNVATVDDKGLVTAVRDGRAFIVITDGARRASTMVEVERAAAPYPLTFRNHVMPVLTKVGCNSGPCHGALAGKSGFKLTLRGYDPEADYLTLTRQATARRVNPVEPARSLMLLKPTLAVSHGGGRRFATGSAEYRILSQWIAAGIPAPSDSDPVMTHLEVFPSAARLHPGDEQPIVVRARFSDGHAEDVTRWARFTTNEGAVATVGDDGVVKVQGTGEAAISAWYLSRVVTARIASPFPARIDPAAYARAPRANFIDDAVLRKLQELNIDPSPLSSDSEFVRRVFLDAAGILPSADEVRGFVADPRPDKRARLIDALIERPEFVDYWAYKWSDLLLVSSRSLQSNAMWAYYNWIRASVAANKPWDEMTRELLTASGNALSNGAANYYVLHKNPVDLTENAALTFMGFSITCARCHNHPLERWTQKDYYQMANLFSRVAIKNGSERGDIIVFSAKTGDINHPRLNAPLPPRPLDGQPLALDSEQDRRQYFADWLVSPDNPFFARALVNRLWKNFMGRGLVEAVDDIRDANPPSNPELLAALTRDFVDHRFDVKQLARTIINSSTYQLSSRPTATNAADLKYHSHYIAKRLPAEVILDAIGQVTGVPEVFPGFPGRRALQLPDAAVDSYFLTAFGRPSRVTAADSERQQEPSITQALHVINGDTINRKLAAPRGLIAGLVASGADNGAALELLYLSALSRKPTDEELRTLSRAMDDAAARDAAPATARRRVLEDLAWAILTGKEFLFNQ